MLLAEINGKFVSELRRLFDVDNLGASEVRASTDVLDANDSRQLQTSANSNRY